MNPVSVLPLKDHIIEILRREIFSGGMENGLELTQESIADQLKVSRIPVREAFLQLEAEGLLERLPKPPCTGGRRHHHPAVAKLPCAGRHRGGNRPANAERWNAVRYRRGLCPMCGRL